MRERLLSDLCLARYTFESEIAFDRKHTGDTPRSQKGQFGVSLA
jgi:hypothetical protein